MKEQLLKAWQINNGHNLALIKSITDRGFDCTLSKRGGRTVGQQLIHVHNVRAGWLEHTAKDLLKETYLLDKETTVTRKLLTDAFHSSGKTLEKLFDRSWDEDGRLTGFKGGLFRFFGYLISHDAHHRGNILLTLKMSGEKIPDSVRWGLWEW